MIWIDYETYFERNCNNGNVGEVMALVNTEVVQELIDERAKLGEFKF